MSRRPSLVDTPLCIALSVGSLASGYLGVLTIVGARRPHRRPTTNRHRFAILVPAHDEAAVIARTLASLDRLDYPADRFEVHVVADNCTDDTATIVEASRWKVHRRDAPEAPGKAAALNWLFDRLDSDPASGFDIVMVIDADTVVHEDLLGQLDAAFTDDVDAVQARYSVIDPDTSSATALRAAALAARHHLRPLARTRLGGSSGLYGNGMAFRRSLLRSHPWRPHLVEDAELQVRLALEGVRVAYAPHARIDAEMPDTLTGSSTQHQRWELGRAQLVREYTPALAGGVIRGRSNRIVQLDTLGDLLMPPLSLVVAGQAVVTSLSAMASLWRPRHRRQVAWGTVSLAVMAGHVLIALWATDAPRSTYRSLLDAPAAIGWKLRTLAGIATDPGRVEWRRTARNTESDVP